MALHPTPTPEQTQIFAEGIFAGRVAVVTGGGSGIGLSTAREYLRLGASVAICGRSQDKLDAASAELIGLSDASRVLAMQCDIRQPEQIDAFVDAVIAKFETIDFLVNNAGGQFPAPAHAISPKGFAAVVRNNLNGTFNMTVAVANKAMIPQKRGCIVNVIANIYRGFPGMVHTGAARAGVENMTMTLAVEWSRLGIVINAVAPGIILSSGTKQYPPEIIAGSIARCPLKRGGTEEEVAATILFLCTPAASFISGSTVRIDGAQSLWGDTFPLPDSLPE